MKRTHFSRITFALAVFLPLVACSDEGATANTPLTVAPDSPDKTRPAPAKEDSVSAVDLPPALAKKAVASHDNPTSVTACFTRADAAALKTTTFTSGDGCVMAVNLGADAPAKYNIAASAAERRSGQKDACCYVAPKAMP